jgi:hypothetical protein
MQPEELAELAEFEFVSPPPFPDAPLPDATALHALQAIEQEMQRTPCVLPEAPVSDFPAPMMTVMYSPHQLALEGARGELTAALTPLAAELPRGVKVDALAASLRPVFVPRWYLKGNISGNWSASGVEITSREVDCSECKGSGKRGLGINQKDCESCWGSGKEKQTSRSKHPESGAVSAALLESLDNHDCGAGLTLEVALDSEPLLLPDESRMRLRCLRPASVYSSNALDAFKNRLASTIEAQARAGMSRYSRIDDFLFDAESVRSHSAVAAWLYPAYLGWCEAQGGRCYALCDALTGKVSWVQAAPVASGAPGGRVESNPWAMLVAGAVALLAALAIWYGLSH